jgi:drug/metabolite transporter (DMT)-like permease
LTDDRQTYRLGLALVLFSTVSWSTAGYFVRLIALDSWTLLFWRGVFGALTALVFALVQQRGRIVQTFGDLGGPGLWFSLASGLGMTAYLSALRLTSVAHVAIIYAALPFAAAVTAAIVLRERTSAGTLAASAVAFAGVVVVMAGGAGEGALSGDLVAVAMTLLMAAMIVISRRYRGIPMVAAGCVSAIVAASIALPFADPLAVSTRDLAWLAVFGATNMGLGLILFTIGSKYIPAAETALISALEAPLGPFWVWLAFGETPLPATIAGGALVMVAVVSHVLGGQAMRTRTVPTPSTVPSNRSPRTTAPTPAGVPVKIRSPGASTTRPDR